MQLRGPERYLLTFDASVDDRCVVRCAQGTAKFSGIASERSHKLYVVSRENWPIYVGVTTQRMSTRLRLGFTAKGASGYHGYAWRRTFKDAVLDIWAPTPGSGNLTKLDAETIEAEIVHLIRLKGQWPQWQTEIHFHPSNEVHRQIAASILGHYELPRT